MTGVMMREGYMLLYKGRQHRDPDEIRPDIRQAYCASCGKLWNISRKQRICPYFCPRCTYHRKKKESAPEEEARKH